METEDGAPGHTDCVASDDHAEGLGPPKKEKAKLRKTPLQQLRERIETTKIQGKTIFDWLRVIGVEDDAAFIWSFVCALMILYMQVQRFFLFFGVMMFIGWLWKDFRPQKEFFVGVFVAFVFFSVFAAVFQVGNQSAARNREMFSFGAPVSAFTCQETDEGAFVCQFFPAPAMPPKTAPPAKKSRPPKSRREPAQWL